MEMAMNGNVMIKLSLLERIFELLDGLDTSRYGYNYCCEYDEVFQELNLKMQKLELRKAYARIIAAEDDEVRAEARSEYLRQKRRMGKVGAEFFEDVLALSCGGFDDDEV
jgi:hypothetical protein